MPSEKVLEQKQQLVKDLKENLGQAVAGVVVDYKGITVADDTKLRRELREAGIHYFVVKNTMLRRALEGSGYEELENVLEGTTALALSNEDPVAAARILQKYADDTQTTFAVKAGFVEGKTLDVEGVKNLASLPTKEQLLAQLCSALNGNIRGLAVALNAIVEKQGEGEVA